MMLEIKGLRILSSALVIKHHFMNVIPRKCVLQKPAIFVGLKTTNY